MSIDDVLRVSLCLSGKSFRSTEIYPYSVKKIITVDAEPEPEQKTVLLDKNQVVFPVIFGKEKRVAAGVGVTVLENFNGVAKIKIEKPDTDYQVFYVFKLEGCWFLDEIQDYSL
ncbi:hypothetical protein LJJ44_23520 [Pseudomonas sp. B24_DOA]|nr:hypothetical protein LJJ44_23520 [Pseudomonas sp. B24_DOA]